MKLKIGNMSPHQDSNDNGVRIVNFATSKYLVVKSIMFPLRNIHKYTWTSPNGKTHNQIDHILIDRRWHSSILDVQSFRKADCDTDHYLVFASVRERLAVGNKHCIDILALDAGLLARSQYLEGPATGHLDTGFSWFPCVYKRMLRRFPSFQVATTCFSCSPPDLIFLVTPPHICVRVK